MQKEYKIKAEIYEIESEKQKSPSWITLILTLIPLFFSPVFWLAIIAFALIIVYLLLLFVV